MSPWPRIIAHADMDAFYASVEQHDDPTLRGKPVLIGPRSQRGVVLTASYEARPFGVGSAMPMARARLLCPQAVIVPPRFERYQEVSGLVMRAFENFSPLVEALSLDEAFIDMTGSSELFGSPREMASRIQRAVFAATGLTVSVGISNAKYVAKVASGFAKPNGITVVPPEHVRTWLAPQPVSNLWGAGAKTTARLNALGYHCIGDIAAAAEDVLTRQLGRAGAHFYALARGDDLRPVVNQRPAVSVGSERTLERNALDLPDVLMHLRRSADRIGERLRAKQTLAGGVRVKLKTATFQLITRQQRLKQPTDLAEDLFAAASKLARRFDSQGPFRLVGMAAYDLRRGADAAQLDLFAAVNVGEGKGRFKDMAKQRRLEETMDSLTARFGRGALKRARDIRDTGTVMGDAPTLDFLNKTQATAGDETEFGDEIDLDSV